MVAHRTIGELLRLQAPRLHKLLPFFGTQSVLLGAIEEIDFHSRHGPLLRIALVLDVKIKNLLARAQLLVLRISVKVLLWVTVALKTPRHEQRSRLIGNLHVLNRTMALITADPLIDMN